MKTTDQNFISHTCLSVPDQETALVIKIALIHLIYFMQTINLVILIQMDAVSGQKFAMNQIKTTVSTVLRKMVIRTLGSKDDIEISTNLVIRIESLPKMELSPI